ncbi:MAG: tRNA (adenosine(37)-N6)-dimethylallyltransferase MiaA [Candidatus Limnocylindria bacterium]
MAAASPLIGIVGATGSGKTELALALARTWPVEIVVADSRQVYRGMDIGTAKPSAAARTAVPHHLLDIAEPDDPFTVANWVERARSVIPDIAARGHIPMVVGGTGLYVSALLDGHDYGAQASSPEMRGRLELELATDGIEALAARLVARDPGAAKVTDLRNPRRLLRALERAEAGGGSSRPAQAPYPGRSAVIGISRPRDGLYRRIDLRARSMFASGLLDEVRALVEHGYADAHPMSGHGYAESMRHLAGAWSLDEAVERTARRTRQYAKRQLTWFRRDVRLMWVAAGEHAGDDPAVVGTADRLLRAALS